MDPVTRQVKIDDLKNLLALTYAAQYGLIEYSRDPLESAQAKITDMEAGLMRIEECLRNILKGEALNLSSPPQI